MVGKVCKGENGNMGEQIARNPLVGRHGRELPCLNCNASINYGDERCAECGTRYVWEDILDFLSQTVGIPEGHESDGIEPLFDQGGVECGYFDVKNGIVAYLGRPKGGDGPLECTRCGTILEIELDRCPLCGGTPKRMVAGIAKIITGLIPDAGDISDSGDNIPREQLAEGEEYLQFEDFHGHDSIDDSKPILPVLPSEKGFFVHLNVESGEIDYLTRDLAPGNAAIANVSCAQKVEIDAFDRIKMIFDDQSSTILSMTANGPMTASEICHALNVPRSVCYRKLKILTDAHLLNARRIDDVGDAHTTRYLSNIDMVYVSLENGDMKMVVRMKGAKKTPNQ
jgi:RNA polymerase subunit RPABC4/transcription elongation factor Spt4/DNA-binding transcriptional ArsR family regulator